MIPFVRTVEEAKRVLDVMASNGLRQGEDGFEVYAMCEIPANVLCADEFLEVFDGYSIGSNDLTQLVLGVDRDSGTVAHLFDERNAAVRRMLSQVIEAAKRAGKPIGICGQAPSDYPELAGWLVEQGIDSLSLNADALLKMKHVISSAETGAAQAARSRPRSGSLMMKEGKSDE
jgi:pyruvate,water dikinase